MQNGLSGKFRNIELICALTDVIEECHKFIDHAMVLMRKTENMASPAYHRMTFLRLLEKIIRVNFRTFSG